MLRRDVKVLKRWINPNKLMVALTFDDGPSSYTPRILDSIEKYNQAATFFVVGYNATRYGSTMTRAYNLGCEIGSHNSTVRSAVTTPLIMWSIDTLDWQTRNTWSTVNCVLNNVSDGDLVFMHDIHSPTVAAAEILIPELVNRGYQLITVSELAQYRGNGMQAGVAYHSFR